MGVFFRFTSFSMFFCFCFCHNLQSPYEKHSVQQHMWFTNAIHLHPKAQYHAQKNSTY